MKPNLCPNIMENEMHDHMDLALHDNGQEVHRKSNENLVDSKFYFLDIRYLKWTGDNSSEG